jgi:ribosome-binding protein aMBF1 (putative translation factor)
MKTHAELKQELLSDPEVRREYERLGPEFELIQSLIRARSRAGLTQAELAERMKTTQSVIARLEGGRSTPSWKTLRRYAEATGSHLRVSLDA